MISTVYFRRVCTRLYSPVLALVILLPGCGGGGGSSENGMLIEGRLVQGDGGAHSAILRHGAGEPIEHVQICALGDCTDTDLDGSYGLIADPSFRGGRALFSIDGHGIDADVAVDIPAGSEHVTVNFTRVLEGIEASVSDHSDGHDHGGHE